VHNLGRRRGCVFVALPGDLLVSQRAAVSELGNSALRIACSDYRNSLFLVAAVGYIVHQNGGKLEVLLANGIISFQA